MSRPSAALAILLVLAASLIPAPGASAAEAPGYIRLGHLSPDTAAADLSLTALSGGTVYYSLKDIPYGGVSKFMSLAPGTYALSMAPSQQGTNTPLVTAEVTVTSGKAVTIAAVGPNASIHLMTIQDDLTPPAAGRSRARAVQASTKQDSVAVATAEGTVLLDKAKFATVGDYTDVAPGAARLTLSTPSGTSSATVQLVDGAAQTLFVLDDASGGLTVLAVLDSAGITEMPVGGMGTGGGALALAARTAEQTMAGGILLGFLTLILVIAVVRGRRAGTAGRG